MAPDLRAVSITIYNKSWSIVLSIPSWDFYDDNTVWEVLEDSRVVALWITEISTAQWWTAAPHSNTLHNYTQSGTELNIVFYDVTPTPSTLTSHGHIDTLHMRHVHEQDDYTAMRWPCPEGYHIPSYNERTSIKAMFSAMWASVNSWTFKVPPTWAYYYGSNSTKHWINQTWSIRCCNTYSNESWAKIYDMRDVYANSKNALMPIRAFKDVPVVPNSSWSVIFDWSSTAVWAWIFWSESLWLFSISSDWINWKTLADKNVWATQVWTNKTAACVWYIFQRWNNHWFTYASTPTFSSTTSTQVDTTWYWPGNYYSSNVYYDGWRDWDWSSPSNNNLWWWTTWIIPGDDHREPVYYGPQPTLRTEAEILGATDIDTLISELNSHSEEYYNMLLDWENCRLGDACWFGDMFIMTKPARNYYKICGKVVLYASSWVWEYWNSGCPL